MRNPNKSTSAVKRIFSSVSHFSIREIGMKRVLAWMCPC